MSQISENRRKRRLKRIIGFSLTGLLMLSGLLWWLLKEEPPIIVKTGSLYYGDITSVMMVSARIQPGSVEEIMPAQQQRVLKVHTSPGDQVSKGDLLLTLDQSELREQYEQAKESRLQIEQSITQSEATAKAQEQALQSQAIKAQQAQEELNRQTASLVSSLSDTTAGLVQLSSIQPAVVDINPELSEKLSTELADFDAEAPEAQAQLQAALSLLAENVEFSENPAYRQQLTQLDQELQQLSNTAASLITSLNSASTGGATADISGQLAEQLGSQLTGQLGGLGSSLESALAQATAFEQAAETSLSESISELRSSADGVVAIVNAAPGDYTGINALNTGASASLDMSNPDLSALLGGGSTASLQGLTGSSSMQPAVVIYDNTRPKAVFQASQFDSKRIAKDMPVTFDYDGISLSGSISYIAPFATGSQFGDTGSTASSFSAELSGLGGLGDISSEPSLLVEMTIKGNNLHQLIPGFKIDAQIETDSADNILILPAEAMRREIDSWYVFIVDENNTVRRQDFTPGIQADMSVEVIDGLTADDKVILNPSTQLEEGMVVEIDNSGNDEE